MVQQQGEPVLPVPEKQNLSYNEAGPHFNVIVPPGDFFPPPQISGVHAVHQYKSMVGRLFQNCRFKNAVFAPTNRDNIDSMVNKIDSICTMFDSIIRGGCGC